MFENPDSEAIAGILKTVKTIAVVGLSPNPARPSHGVAAYLQRAGYRIVPVNPTASAVLGEQAYARLSDIPFAVDIVEVFRAPDYVDDIVTECIALGVPRLWLQDGVINEPAALRAKAAGITVVMNRCMLRDHRNLLT
jgi:predicted CoA-binding protein